ncbi:hypothetical protein [Chamaesiphon sp. VAR_69_metabat_338]|uniref:hypothetical protein n=1 Tax=Chamaesiphon sp. VAR_69_metabat_338 TaxID=2964704 RepID=UPI00286E32F6|nr:hypothetical protein [Chamaesiphon sp. VAR_69_metabat_338]
MTAWEFLIQREGDRGWRTIKTGNLQMTEGRYRIAATSQLLDPQMQTRMTHQPLGATATQQRSSTAYQVIAANGLAIVMPFTDLQSGIWQFVCSGTTLAQTPWHQILKLRVLPRPQSKTPVGVAPQAVAATPAVLQSPLLQAQHEVPAASVLVDRTTTEDREDLPQPTAPLVSLSMTGEQESWADGLDRLLAQLERDSLRTRRTSATMPSAPPDGIQIAAITDLPSQLISLDRSTFSGIVPGHRLTVSGACNLPLLNINLVQTVKIEKLSICLRHPQTAETIVSIEHPIPADLDKFGFSGQLQLPAALKVSLLLGEVNLYDRHHIQIASRGFTIAVNLNPLHESEQSLLHLLDRDRSVATMAQLDRDLDIEATTIGVGSSTPARQFATPSTVPPVSSPQYPTVPLAYRRESVFAHQPEIVPVAAPPSSPDVGVETIGTEPLSPSQPFDRDITGDLEIDFASPAFDRASAVRDYPNLEIVVD